MTTQASFADVYASSVRRPSVSVDIAGRLHILHAETDTSTGNSMIAKLLMTPMIFAPSGYIKSSSYSQAKLLLLCFNRVVGFA